MPFHDFENAKQFSGRLVWIVEKRFEITAEDRERRPQLVRDVRHEIAPHFFHPAEMSNVTEQNYAAFGVGRVFAKRDSGDFELTRFAAAAGELDRIPLWLLRT